MGRLRSKVAPHARQRYSYRGTREAYVTPVSRGSGGAGRGAGTADGCPLACPFRVADGAVPEGQAITNGQAAPTGRPAPPLPRGSGVT